jgi:hypothetical protein
VTQALSGVSRAEGKRKEGKRKEKRATQRRFRRTKTREAGTMTEADRLESHCATCMHWREASPHEGACRRFAPDPCDAANEAAHWPRTHGAEGCGEWRVRSVEASGTTCGRCLYWDHPVDGLRPEARADQSARWWEQAGHCRRRAPKPSNAPGWRAFWRATHVSDGCCEGESR